MYEVIIQSPDGRQSTHLLAQNTGLILGREDGCDIVLASKQVSRRHARLFSVDKFVRVEDIGSQNGIAVGGKQAEGVVELPLGAVLTIGDFQIVVQKEGRQNATASGVAIKSIAGKLIGQGSVEGVLMKLPEKTAIFGRDEGSPLTLGHESISRKHAEFRNEGSWYIVKDLGSANGSYVNGQKLNKYQEVRLSAGDKVRLGETHWLYSVEDNVQKAQKTQKFRVILLISAAIMLVGLAAVALLKQPSDQPKIRNTPIVKKKTIEQLISQGKQNIQSEKFEAAKESFEQALEEDPLNADARTLLRKATQELAYSQAFKDAMDKQQIGRDDEALAAFYTIPTDAKLFTKAKYQVQQLAVSAKKQHLSNCKDALKRKQSEKAVESCTKYLNLTCHIEPDAAIEKSLNALKSKASAWVCPPELSVWFSASMATGINAELQKSVAAKYPDPALQEAVLAYMRGELSVATRALSAAKGKAIADAKALQQLLIPIDEQMKEAQAATVRQNYPGIEKAYEAILEIDAKISPPTQDSSVKKQIKEAFIKAIVTEAKVASAGDDLTRATELYKKAISLAPGDSTLIELLKSVSQTKPTPE